MKKPIVLVIMDGVGKGDGGSGKGDCSSGKASGIMPLV